MWPDIHNTGQEDGRAAYSWPVERKLYCPDHVPEEALSNRLAEKRDKAAKELAVIDAATGEDASDEAQAEALAEWIAQDELLLQSARDERAEEQRARRLPIMISHEERSGKKKKHKKKKKDDDDGRIGLGLSQRKKVEFPPDIFDEGTCVICLGSHSKLQVGEHVQASEPTVQCIRCKIHVHPQCYGLVSGSYEPGSWVCHSCTQQATESDSFTDPKRLCALCPRQGGAFKQTNDKTPRWVHVTCALVVAGARTLGGERREPCDLRAVKREHKGAMCQLCNRKKGVVTQCAKDGCNTQIHPYCAMVRKCFVDVQNQKAYCIKHAPTGYIFNHESRKWTQPGSEVRALARLRHQMDHARVLMDRVRRREKVKRQIFNADTSLFDEVASQISDALAVRMGEPDVEDEDGGDGGDGGGGGVPEEDVDGQKGGGTVGNTRNGDTLGEGGGQRKRKSRRTSAAAEDHGGDVDGDIEEDGAGENQEAGDDKDKIKSTGKDEAVKSLFSTTADGSDTTTNDGAAIEGEAHNSMEQRMSTMELCKQR
jgi:hypothetical protein